MVKRAAQVPVVARVAQAVPVVVLVLVLVPGQVLQAREQPVQRQVPLQWESVLFRPRLQSVWWQRV